MTWNACFLVLFCQEQLRSKQQESETKVETPTVEIIDFKTKFAETKAYAKVFFRLFVNACI